MSLREKYKTMVQDSILQNATELIIANGFAKTTVEMIAEKSGVGVGTVYNYFPSKNELLAAFIELKTDEKKEKAREIVAREYTDPAQAIHDLIWVYVGMAFEIPRKVFQEGYALFLSNIDTIGRNAVEHEQACADQMQQMGEKLQTQGLISAGIDTQSVRNLIWACKEFIIQRRLFFDQYSEQQAETELKEMVALFWDGLKART